MYFKHRSTFFIGEEDIMIKRPLGKKITVHYEDIFDMSVAQGMLAKRLDCGSVYMILKKGYGGVTLMGGGVAEKLDDVPKPQTVYDLISTKMSPFSGA
jgi:hypothetical protein